MERRVSAEADDNERAETAVAVLREIVRDLRGRDQAVASVLLVTNPDFEGETIDARIRTLDPTAGVTPTNWPKLRPPVMAKIIKKLQAPGKSAYTPPISEAVRELNRLVADSYLLLHTVDAYWFCAEMTPEDFSTDMRVFSEPLLMHCIRFISSASFCIGSYPFSISQQVRLYLGGSHFSELSDSATALITQIIDEKRVPLVVNSVFRPAPSPVQQDATLEQIYRYLKEPWIDRFDEMRANFLGVLDPLSPFAGEHIAGIVRARDNAVDLASRAFRLDPDTEVRKNYTLRRLVEISLMSIYSESKVATMRRILGF